MSLTTFQIKEVFLDMMGRAISPSLVAQYSPPSIGSNDDPDQFTSLSATNDGVVVCEPPKTSSRPLPKLIGQKFEDGVLKIIYDPDDLRRYQNQNSLATLLPTQSDAGPFYPHLVPVPVPFSPTTHHSSRTDPFKAASQKQPPEISQNSIGNKSLDIRRSTRTSQDMQNTLQASQYGANVQDKRDEASERHWDEALVNESDR